MVTLGRFSVRSRSSGFSLLEVLIAALILFMVLSGATLVYSSSVKSRNSAENAILLHGLSPLLQEHVNIQVGKGVTEGRAEVWEVSYNWKAKSIEQKRIVGNSQFIQVDNARMVFLYQVEMEMSYRGRKESVNFEVVSWN